MGLLASNAQAEPDNQNGGSSAEPIAPLLSVRDLSVSFSTRRGVGTALNSVSFDLYPGETLGLVGESGSGKSTTASAIAGVLPQPPARVDSGQIVFDGRDLLQIGETELQAIRGRDLGVILQDPLSALNPVFNIGFQIGEPLHIHKDMRGNPLKKRIVELLEMLRIPAAEERLRDFPHQFSGGMRQRVVSAIAASCDPKLLIADEPTTALDVTVQAAYLRLLKSIQERTGVAIVFITHDFAVVAKMCDRVAVMYGGSIVEEAPVDVLFNSPAHPYTEALLNSVPDVRVDVDRLTPIEGAPPSIFDPTPGCRFAPRCPHVMEKCRTEAPREFETAPGQRASCWRHE